MEKALLAKSIHDFEKEYLWYLNTRLAWECEQAKKIYKTQCFMLNKYMMHSSI